MNSNLEEKEIALKVKLMSFDSLQPRLNVLKQELKTNFKNGMPTATIQQEIRYIKSKLYNDCDEGCGLNENK